MEGVYGYRITTNKTATVLEALGDVFGSLQVPEGTDPEIMLDAARWAETAVPEPGHPHPMRATVEDGAIVTPGGVAIHVDGEQDGSKTWVEIEFRRPSITAARLFLQALADRGFCDRILLMGPSRVMYEDYPGCGAVERGPDAMLEAVAGRLKLALDDQIERYASWKHA